MRADETSTLLRGHRIPGERIFESVGIEEELLFAKREVVDGP
jgi:hypothetical protein